jgi:hypothetical protein
MDIHQLNLSYLPEHDRLLLRVSTKQGDELAVWLTRKVTLAIWPALQGCAQSHAARSYAGKSNVSDPILRKELAEFSSAKHLQTADFNTPYVPISPVAKVPNYSPQRTATLQGTPLLPIEIKLEAKPNGHTQLELKEAQRNVSMLLDEQLLHAIMQLIEQTVVQADWGVNLVKNSDTVTTNPVLN